MSKAKDVPFAVWPSAWGAHCSSSSEGLPENPRWASTVPGPLMSNSGPVSGEGRGPVGRIGLGVWRAPWSDPHVNLSPTPIAGLGGDLGKAFKLPVPWFPHL